MRIEVDSTSFSYGRGRPAVLKDVSVNFDEGEIHVLLGLNGCGKTTLIKTMVGFLRPQRGSIRYGETDLKTIPYHTRSKYVSYVPQGTPSIGDFQVDEYLCFGACNAVKFYSRPGEEILARAGEISEFLCLEPYLHKRMDELSGGQRQMVFIGAALMQDAETIILDEPTSALDLKNQMIVLRALSKIASQGKTIILTTHQPNHALFLDAKTYLMKGGRILQSGPAAAVIRTDNLKEVYGPNVCLSKELAYEEISFRG